MNKTFYFDETNNERRVDLNKNFNKLKDRNFVLGGVMHQESFNMESIDNLFLKLRLQKNIVELKIKNLSKKKRFSRFYK